MKTTINKTLRILAAIVVGVLVFAAMVAIVVMAQEFSIIVKVWCCFAIIIMLFAGVILIQLIVDTKAWQILTHLETDKKSITNTGKFHWPEDKEKHDKAYNEFNTFKDLRKNQT